MRQPNDTIEIRPSAPREVTRQHASFGEDEAVQVAVHHPAPSFPYPRRRGWSKRIANILLWLEGNLGQT
jgi:hypothetical protein